MLFGIVCVLVCVRVGVSSGAELRGEREVLCVSVED